ncbi:MAG: type III secretion system export apparatus subunit SctU [Deltaproteobacteria bacterium]|jgi:type III secretion protein U|nr:type III secretion system export apparatus subunit SctU [Deltaproteobacteria bacterium]
MSQEKTEQPTSKRLRDAREKGQVARSQEVPSAAVVMVTALYFVIRGPYLLDLFEQTAEAVFKVAWTDFNQAYSFCLAIVGLCLLKALGPLIPTVVVVSALSNMAQIGVLVSFQAALPKLENLSPAKWFKKTFSKNNLFELLKSVVKVIVVSTVVWKVISRDWASIMSIPIGNAKSLSKIIGSSLGDMVIYAAVAFAILAIIDFIYQKFKYIKDNMMSKEEVMREYKESEGDPLIKSKRRQLHQEMANQNSVNSVSKAKVLVTNPTHYAVAIDYEEGKNDLPVILSKGEGETAKRMIAEAKRLGVPIMREATLARDLFENGLEYSYIPKDLIEPVAEVLKWLRTLDRR